MLRFWLVCFAILFVMAELWERLQELTLPFPVCAIGGIALAIASNWHFASMAPPSSISRFFQHSSDSQQKQFPPFSQD